jgi:hypothetical protein
MAALGSVGRVAARAGRLMTTESVLVSTLQIASADLESVVPSAEG